AVEADAALVEAGKRLGAHAGKVAVVVSPLLSLEDALAVMALAKDGLGASEIFVSGRAAGEADRLLLRGDRNPNRKGVELAAQAFGLAVRAFDELPKAKAKGLLLAGLEIPKAEDEVVGWLGAFETVVALGTNLS